MTENTDELRPIIISLFILISTENIQFKTQAEAEGLSALTTSERKVRSVSAEH